MTLYNLSQHRTVQHDLQSADKVALVTEVTFHITEQNRIIDELKEFAAMFTIYWWECQWILTL